MKRRSLLGTAGAALTGLTAGCSSVLCRKPGPEAERGVRDALGAPVSRSRTIRDEGEHAYEYVPSNDTVRYASATSGARVYEYDYLEWAEISAWEIETVARIAVRDTIHASVDAPELRVRAEVGAEPYAVRAALVTRTDDGCVIATPNAGYENVRAAAPTSVTATVRIPGREEPRTETVDVGVEKTVKEVADPA